MQEQAETRSLQQFALLDVVARAVSLHRAEAVKTAVTHALLLGALFLILVIGVDALSSFWPAIAAFRRNPLSDGFMVAMLIGAMWILVSNARQSRVTTDYELELLKAEVERLRGETGDRY